jgi:ABC-2 type transport system ATP-binding protein
MLVRLKSEGVALLYTTHYMEEAQRLCDRIAIMNEGAVVATGTPNELAEQIGEPEADLEQVFLQLTGRSLKDL